MLVFYERLCLSCDYYQRCYQGFCKIRTSMCACVFVQVRIYVPVYVSTRVHACNALFFHKRMCARFFFFFFHRMLLLCRSYNLAVIISFTLRLTQHHLTSQSSVMKLNMPYPIQHGMSSSVFEAQQSRRRLLTAAHTHIN